MRPLLCDHYIATTVMRPGGRGAKRWEQDQILSMQKDAAQAQTRSGKQRQLLKPQYRSFNLTCAMQACLAHIVAQPLLVMPGKRPPRHPPVDTTSSNGNANGNEGKGIHEVERSPMVMPAKVS